MSCGVIVVAPPWPRSGSGNIFAAQVAAHARRGARVLLLLAPPHRGYARHKTEFWRDAVAAMRYPGVDTVAYPRTGRGRVRAYLNWLTAGCDDTLAITARFAASGRLPAEPQPFLASVQVGLIHVNHAFSMPLALRVAGLVHRMQGRRPRILLDTHDIRERCYLCAAREQSIGAPARRPCRAVAHGAGSVCRGGRAGARPALTCSPPKIFTPRR